MNVYYTLIIVWAADFLHFPNDSMPDNIDLKISVFKRVNWTSPSHVTGRTLLLSVFSPSIGSIVWAWALWVPPATLPQVWVLPLCAGGNPTDLNPSGAERSRSFYSFQRVVNSPEVLGDGIKVAARIGGGKEKSDLEPQGHGWRKDQFERVIPKMTTFIFNNSVVFTYFRRERKWRGSRDYKYGHKEMPEWTWQGCSPNDTVSLGVEHKKT